MIQLNLINETPIENLPYEMLEEVAKKILPTNINPNEISFAFQAILSLAQMNRKMYLFIHSDRIKNHVINVIGKNIHNLPSYVGKNFLRWQVLSNGLDQVFLGRVFNEIQKMQKIIHSVLRKVDFSHIKHQKEYMPLIKYQSHNFARHQVRDVMQPKTCLVISFYLRRNPLLRIQTHNRIEMRYPFGTMTISHLDYSATETLVNILKTPFEGIFEKQRQVECGLVQHIEKAHPEGNEPFEFIEDSNSRPPYIAIGNIREFFLETNSKIIPQQAVESKKGRPELVFSRHPRAFSCYQIQSDVFENIFGRDRYDEEMKFLSQLFLFYCTTTTPNYAVPRERIGIQRYSDYTGSPDKILENYLNIDRTSDYNS